jgi:hypothetical protein
MRKTVYTVWWRQEAATCHLSHCTPGFVIRAVSVFGRDPPEMATVNLRRLSMDSFCALRIYSASESERFEVSGKE